MGIEFISAEPDRSPEDEERVKYIKSMMAQIQQKYRKEIEYWEKLLVEIDGIYQRPVYMIYKEDKE